MNNIIKMGLINEYGGQFADYSNLKYVTMKSIQYIQPYLFANCSKLVYVDMPNVKKIDDFSFSRCYSLYNLRF